MEATPFFNRGPSPLAKLVIFSLLSITMMLTDAYFSYLNPVRKAISFLMHPLEEAVTEPFRFYPTISHFFVTHGALMQENQTLRSRELLQAAKLTRMAALEMENRHLRAMLDIRETLHSPSIAAEIIHTGQDPFAQRVLIDKGTVHGITDGDAVMDNAGIIGQVTRAMPLDSEVTLITDKDQTTPVESLQSGVRAIVVGHGGDSELEIPFMPVNTPIKEGEWFVTSGIDGVYPRGIPVAIVTRVERNAAYAFARITCRPVAGPNRYRQVLVVGPDQPQLRPPRQEAAKVHDANSVKP